MAEDAEMKKREEWTRGLGGERNNTLGNMKEHHVLQPTLVPWTNFIFLVG